MSDARRDLVPGVISDVETELPRLNGSLAFTNGPVARALLEFALASGYGSLEDLGLVSHNDGQLELISWIVKNHAEIPQLRDLTSMAGHDWQALNSFLVGHGFDPLFTQFDPADMGICSIVKKAMQWTMAGTPTSIYCDVDGERKQFPGFKLGDDAARIQPLRDDIFTERVVVSTQGTETVYLAMLPESMEGPRDGAHLLKLVRQMLGARMHLREYNQGGVVLPMISFDQVSEVSWLDGMGIITPDGKPSTLASCRQHVKFYMNEFGARLEAAFAGVVSRGMAPKPFVVDRHFVLAVVDGTTSTTVLYLHPEDSWSEPPAGIIG